MHQIYLQQSRGYTLGVMAYGIASPDFVIAQQNNKAYIVCQL